MKFLKNPYLDNILKENQMLYNNDNEDSNIITEVLEDGTIHSFDLDICNEEADSVIDELAEKQDIVLNFDFTATIFSLFVSSIQILSTSGWSTEDLLNEVLNHTQADDICTCGDDHDDDDDEQ